MKKIRINWSAYLKLIDTLFAKIPWEEENFDRIVAINRGGNIIGTILSHKTDIPLTIINASEELPDGCGKLLIIDEIADSGHTFLKVISRSDSNIKYKTATLHTKATSKVTPDFFVKQIKHWIVYPYENM
jgi:hypoxanthine phosphoribosyltransferase